MEADAVSATIGVLVQNLVDLSKDEIFLIRGLEESAEKLRITFSTIQSYLDDAQTKSINEAAVKTWLKNLEEKAFEADNALDEINYQFLSNKMKNKAASCFPSFYHCVHRRDVAVRINEINTGFESINKMAMELGLQEKLASAPVAASDVASETDSLTVDPIFIGRDYEVSKMVEMLTTPTEETVSILPIVGMGGLGKTTLVRNIFNHEKIKTHFAQRIWVHVSREFDVGVLLKKILTNLKPDDVEVVSREAVVKKIQEAVRSKICLLVLDDVWNENHLKWEGFINSWSGITSTKGNVILVTTRNAGVGSLIKTHDMHLLNILSEEKCWSIIKARAFQGVDIMSDLEDIGRSIAQRCQGLPLAANVAGGVLRGKSQEEWLSIKENWLSNGGGDENDISRILKLSFHHLSSPSLKKCFAYCFIFSKGARIDRRQLIELWMAEGFLQTSQTSDMETVGNQYLNVLIHNSLLQVVDRDEYGNVANCSMHDLVHDMAGSISDRAYYKRDESSRIQKVQAKWVRTLIYNGRISDIVFSDLKSLHSLTLTGDSGVHELPNSVGELIHLRYLDITYSDIKYLPKSIGKLSHLQTFRSHQSFIYGLKKLPSTFKHLFNLRHLYLSSDTVLPTQLGMLTSLQTLLFFKAQNKAGHRIVELGSLKNLKGNLEIHNLENVQGEEESIKAYLFEKSGILRLELKWNYRREGEINDENVLKGLQPHPNIKILTIDEFKGANFPAWTLKMDVCLEGCWVGLSNLTEIRLKRCVECEEIPTMGHLPHLKYLSFIDLFKVKSIGASFYGVERCSLNNGVHKETISVFPALESLVLGGLDNLREWEEVKIPSGAQVKVFPCLEYLEIKYCNQLRSAPSHEFTSLKKLIICSIDSELPLASICSIKLKTLTKLEIECIEELVNLPDWLFHNNQHLSKLKIKGCPKLVELPVGMHTLNSLEKLTLTKCSKLESIPFSVSGGRLQGLTSLRRLTVVGCRLLITFLGEMEEPFAPVLKCLRISARGSDGWDCLSFNKAVDGILRFGIGSHSLRKLFLSGKEDWESLPDQLQHLTSLLKLEISDFGIEELSEWVAKLSSLQELTLWFCKKLKHLPSVEVMRCLTNLATLDISSCPLLKEKCNEPKSGDDVDSEWPKISHIPRVRL